MLSFIAVDICTEVQKNEHFSEFLIFCWNEDDKQVKELINPVHMQTLKSPAVA